MLIRSLLLTVFCGIPALAAEVSSPRYAVIAADKGHIVRFTKDGKVDWEFKGGGNAHCLKQLPNGNLLTQLSWTRIVEIDSSGAIVWEYDAGKSNGNSGRPIEVHAFERLANGHTMLVENGIGRIIEIDAAGTIRHELKFKVSKPNAHRDCRQAHKLANGNYLLCHEGDGRVTEYDPAGNIVWDYEIPLFGKSPAGGHGPEAFGNQVYNALRLPNGNTIIATGNGHSLLEVSPAREIVWQVHQHDLPGITLAWLTSLEVLPNGNIVFGNCHAGPDNPQIIEIDRNKKVVWTFHDFEALGDATAASATVGVDGVLR